MDGVEHPLKKGRLNGDSNQRASGKDICMCFRKDRNTPSIVDILIISDKPDPGYMPTLSERLNGDLNQSAGGKDIFMYLVKRVVSGRSLPVRVRKRLNHKPNQTKPWILVTASTRQTGPFPKCTRVTATLSCTGHLEVFFGPVEVTERA